MTKMTIDRELVLIPYEAGNPFGPGTWVARPTINVLIPYEAG